MARSAALTHTVVGDQVARAVVERLAAERAERLRRHHRKRQEAQQKQPRRRLQQRLIPHRQLRLYGASPTLWLVRFPLAPLAHAHVVVAAVDHQRQHERHHDEREQRGGEPSQTQAAQRLRGERVEADVERCLECAEEPPHALGHPHGVDGWHLGRDLVPAPVISRTCRCVTHKRSESVLRGNVEDRLGDETVC